MHRLWAAVIVIVSIFLPFFVYGEIQNFHEVDEGFFRGGQPDEKEIEALRALGFRTVVSFRNEERVIQWEKGLVTKNGMAFISIPLTWRKSPSQEKVDHFLKIVSESNRRPLFIHCREGRDRTGAMVALYRIARQGCPVEEAYREAKRYGFRDQAFPLRRFILVKARAFSTPVPSIPFTPLGWLGWFLFYFFEWGVVLFGFMGGMMCVTKSPLAIEIQKKFYELINWEIIPISMKKEIRNTKILGGILLFVSFVLMVSLVIFSI